MKKMRQEVEYFNLIVEGDTEDEHPNAFVKMHIIYELRGKDLDPEKIEKAITFDGKILRCISRLQEGRYSDHTRGKDTLRLKDKG